MLLSYDFKLASFTDLIRSKNQIIGIEERQKGKQQSVSYPAYCYDLGNPRQVILSALVRKGQDPYNLKITYEVLQTHEFRWRFLTKTEIELVESRLNQKTHSFGSIPSEKLKPILVKALDNTSLIS